MKRDYKDQLESIVDACGLREVIDALGELCDEKADHIYLNYKGDDSVGDLWKEAGDVIGNLDTEDFPT